MKRHHLSVFFLVASAGFVCCESLAQSREMQTFFAFSTVGASQIDGIMPGDEMTAEFMLDPNLTPIQIDPTVQFVDPWVFHVHRFVSEIAWMNGFTLEVPQLPIPIPDPPPFAELRVIAPFDNQIPPGGMPNMPDGVTIEGIPVGSQFVLSMDYPPGIIYPNGPSGLPVLPDKSTPFPLGGEFMIMGPTGETLLSAEISRVVPEPMSAMLLVAGSLGLAALRRR